MIVSIREHPRAVRGVRRTRAGAGLAGFVLGAGLAHRAGLPAFDVVLRALVAGVAAHVAGWALALTYWRAIIPAELEALRVRRQAARRAAEDVLRQTAQAADRTS